MQLKKFDHVLDSISWDINLPSITEEQKVDLVDSSLAPRSIGRCIPIDTDYNKRDFITQEVSPGVKNRCGKLVVSELSLFGEQFIEIRNEGAGSARIEDISFQLGDEQGNKVFAPDSNEVKLSTYTESNELDINEHILIPFSVDDLFSSGGYAYILNSLDIIDTISFGINTPSVMEGSDFAPHTNEIDKSITRCGQDTDHNSTDFIISENKTPGEKNSCPKIVINEIDYDQYSTDNCEFVEIINTGTEAMDLSNVYLELIDSSGDEYHTAFDLSLLGVLLPQEMILLGTSRIIKSTIENLEDTDHIHMLELDSYTLLNGYYGLRLTSYKEDRYQFIDGVSYHDNIIEGVTEGTGPAPTDHPTTGYLYESISRCPNGQDTQRNDQDFLRVGRTFGEVNICEIKQDDFLGKERLLTNEPIYLKDYFLDGSTGNLDSKGIHIILKSDFDAFIEKEGINSNINSDYLLNAKKMAAISNHPGVLGLRTSFIPYPEEDAKTVTGHTFIVLDNSDLNRIGFSYKFSEVLAGDFSIYILPEVTIPIKMGTISGEPSNSRFIIADTSAGWRFPEPYSICGLYNGTTNSDIKMNICNCLGEDGCLGTNDEFQEIFASYNKLPTHIHILYFASDSGIGLEHLNPNNQMYCTQCFNSSVYDNDTIDIYIDNCPEIANEDQLDSDNDNVGDACDLDVDGDGVPQDLDNCPYDLNPEQLDIDTDQIGDACDNCLLIPNENQIDVDNDQIGNLCDDDIDGDSILNEEDNCDYVVNEHQFDNDSDGIGDTCDNCPSIYNDAQNDSDSNGVGDECEGLSITDSAIDLSWKGFEATSLTELIDAIGGYENVHKLGPAPTARYSSVDWDSPSQNMPYKTVIDIDSINPTVLKYNLDSCGIPSFTPSELGISDKYTNFFSLESIYFFHERNRVFSVLNINLSVSEQKKKIRWISLSIVDRRIEVDKIIVGANVPLTDFGHFIASYECN